MYEFKIKIQKNSFIWNKFILNSSSPNIFNHSFFLDIYDVDKYFIYKNDEVFGAFSLNRNNELKIEKHNELLYTPIVYKSFLGKPFSSILNEKFLITQEVCNYLYNNEKSGEIIFDHYTEDLRPFFWKNFDSKCDFFSVSDIKYTSIINIDMIDHINLEQSIFFKNFSRRTRQSYRYSINKSNYEIEEYFDVELIKELITETFHRQDLKINFNLDKHIEILKKLKNNNLLKSFICREGQEIKAIAIFGVNDNTATLINAAKRGDASDNHSLLYLYLKSFIELKNIKIDFIDLEGMNSPKRSFFKNGFGGYLKAYYTIKFNTK
jgi:hypothetical protein